MANNNIITMDSLKKGAVQVYSGMIAVYPLFGKEEALNISGLVPKFNGCYATNNSTVCFVTDNEVFVTPYTRTVTRSLCSAGFRENSFWVPFSNGDYPKAEGFKWDELYKKASKSWAEDFADDCVSYCEEHYIGTISAETLKRCFEMPTTGVKVKHHYYEDIYYPLISSTCFDCVAAKYIGHFCANNGKVVFVYRNGKTYVAKGYDILKELREAGYREMGLFVPFSNGEKIQDPVLKARWESISK